MSDSTVRGESFTLGHTWSEGTVHRRGEGMRQEHEAASHISGDQEAERHERQCSPHVLLFLPFLQSGILSHRRVPSTLRVGLPSSVVPLGKHHQRHIQKCVSKVILNVVKLTVEKNHHSPGLYMSHFARSGHRHKWALQTPSHCFGRIKSEEKGSQLE